MKHLFPSQIFLTILVNQRYGGCSIDREEYTRFSFPRRLIGGVKDLALSNSLKWVMLKFSKKNSMLLPLAIKKFMSTWPDSEKHKGRPIKSGIHKTKELAGCRKFGVEGKHHKRMHRGKKKESQCKFYGSMDGYGYKYRSK